MNDPEQDKQSWIRPYYPSFDGIRAVAILSVFYCHYAPMTIRRLHGGLSFAGVDVFFVLSGFLITGILYDTRQRSKFFRTFYIRRSLRILPVYWGLLLAIILLAPILHLVHGRIFFVNFGFVENLLYRWIAVHRAGSPLTNPTIVLAPFGPKGGFNIALGHLWSLCVEEQFYLVWPLVVWLIPNRRKLMTVAAAIAISAIALRCYLYATDTALAESSRYLYVSSYARCDSLLIGAWVALWLRGNVLSNAQMTRISVWLMLAPSAVLMTLLVLAGRHLPFDELHPAMQTVGFTLIALAATGFLLRSLQPSSRLHHWLQAGWLQHLGGISYGFYVYHGLLETYFEQFRDVHLHGRLGPLIFPLAFAFSYLAALISFHLLESPFLKLKKLLAPTDHKSVPDGSEMA